MSETFFFSVGTIGLSTRDGRKPSTLLQAARHNHRQIQAELGANSHIDATRICLNETIAGPDTPEAVVALALHLMNSARVVVSKLRKDYTQAVELLFSLPPDATVDTSGYFRRCVSWVTEQFGANSVLSAIVHRDESAPHCHVLVLALVNGRMCGSSMIARPELVKLRESFVRDVAQAFGLKRPPGRMTGAVRNRAVRMVLLRLETIQDAILKSPIWNCTRQAIERDPAPFMVALGLDLKPVATERATKTMAQIFTSTGKGPQIERALKPIGFGEDSKILKGKALDAAIQKSIGFVHGAEKNRNLCSVGIAPKARPHTSPICNAFMLNKQWRMPPCPGWTQ